MSFFAAYREPPKEWTVVNTGEIVKPVGRLIVSDNLICIADLFKQSLDCEYYDIDDGSEVEKLTHQEGGVRGSITEFSRQSQARLMKKLACWRPFGQVIIVTLTYPRQFPNSRRAGQDFERFRRHLRQRYPELAGMWKLEYQKRGAPHYHMVLETGRTAFSLSHFRAWLDQTWIQSRRSNVLARTQAAWARDPSRAKYYLAKEVGKTAQSSKAWRNRINQATEDHYGRFWGWHQKHRLIFEAREITLPADVIWKIRRRIQSLVLKDMQAGGRVLLNDQGEYVTAKGDLVDKDALPTWQLFDNTDHVVERLFAELAQEGIDIPPIRTWRITNPF